MAIKPILFSTEMVRAILDGRKSCTRRLVKTRRKDACGFYVTRKKTDGTFAGIYEYDENESVFDNPLEPLYQPGDILYVRETVWQKTGHYLDVDGETKAVWCNEFKYVATDEKPETGWNYSWVKRPSIHMPKEAARIWLKVTDVRVERLQEITESGAKAEGIRGYTKDGNLYKYAVTDDWWIDYHNKHKEIVTGTWWQDMPRTAKDAFSYLWNSTIKKSDLDLYGWNANPWVWTIEYERCEKPEGA